MNLLKETKDAIRHSGHTVNQITFIGSEESGYSCTWKQFTKLADFEYDDGYGSQGIATDLIIVFMDGQKLWRHEYDGSERWDYGAPFKMPTKTLPITSLGGDSYMWKDLEDINQKEEE